MGLTSRGGGRRRRRPCPRPGLALHEHSRGWGNGLALTWVGVTDWGTVVVLDDGGGRGCMVVVVVGKEQPMMGSVEPRVPIWPHAGRAVRRSRTHALLSNEALGPCAIVLY